MEPEADRKRNRAPNYTFSEKECLLTIIGKYKEIIKNKKTDALSSKSKKDAWIKVREEFNSSSPNLCNRPLESLKKYYEKLKEDVKKIAKNRKELYKTGGGESSFLEEPGDDILLSFMNKKSVLGLNNPHDSDTLEAITVHKMETNHSDMNIEIVCEEEDNPWDNQNKENEPDNTEENKQIMKKARSDNWKKPIHTTIRKNLEKTYNTPKKSYTGRRRPTIIRTLTASILGQKYNELIDKKIELLGCYKKEHHLSIQSLELDILLRKKQLAAESSRTLDDMLLEGPSNL